MAPELQFQPDVFHGELTANRAQIFVRVPRSSENADCTLTGFVHGPRCEHAHTLPAKFVLQDLGAGPTLLARALVTDPCLWTGDLPHLYDVHVELRRGAELLAKEQRTIGLRGLGVRATSGGKRFVREGKIWVPRGVAIRSLSDEELQSLREQLLVGIYRGHPPLDLLQTASRQGLHLIVELPEEAGNLAETLPQLARWPAVMLVVLPSAESGPALRQIAPNLLLGQRLSLSDLGSVRASEWAHTLVVKTTADDQARARLLAVCDLSLPVIIQNSDRSCQDSMATRADCEALQAALSPCGQFAGYLVAGS